MMNMEEESLFLNQQEICKDENIEECLFNDGLRLDDYYLDKEYGSICFIDDRGVEMEWLIEDELLAQCCKRYLIKHGVRVK